MAPLSPSRWKEEQISGVHLPAFWAQILGEIALRKFDRDRWAAHPSVALPENRLALPRARSSFQGKHTRTPRIGRDVDHLVIGRGKGYAEEVLQ